MVNILSDDEYATELLKGKSRPASEPLNLSYPPADVPEGSTMVYLGGSVYAMPQPPEPPAIVRPWADAPPSDEDLTRLHAEYVRAIGEAERLEIELAALPALKEEAISAGDWTELGRLRMRTDVIPYEIQGAAVGMAKCRASRAEAKLAKAWADRDAASRLASEIGGLAGYPKGKEAGDMATAAYANADANISMAAHEVSDARRHLDYVRDNALKG